MANPRKFSEKIALHNQKQAEETAAFEQIMREVSGATMGAYQKQHLHINQTLGAYRGGSLPNVNQIGNNSIDLQSALNSLEDMKQGRESLVRHERGRHLTGHRRAFPFEKRTDCSPYGSVYLSPPPDTSWRRTNSDSALHTSAMAPSSEGFLGPATPPTHRRVLDMDGGISGDNIQLKGYWDPKKVSQLPQQSRPKSCEVPGINIYPSTEQDTGVHISIANNTGSLPDLTNLHFPSPLATPLDVEDQIYNQPLNINLSPNTMTHNLVRQTPQPSNQQPSSPNSQQRRRHTHNGPQNPLNMTVSIQGSPLGSPLQGSPIQRRHNMAPQPQVLERLLGLNRKCPPIFHKKPWENGILGLLWEDSTKPISQDSNALALDQRYTQPYSYQLQQTQSSPPQQNQAPMAYRNSQSGETCSAPTSPVSQPPLSPASSPGLGPTSGLSSSPFADAYFSQQQQTNALQHQFEQFNMVTYQLQSYQLGDNLPVTNSLNNGNNYGQTGVGLQYSQAQMQGLTESQELLNNQYFGHQNLQGQGSPQLSHQQQVSPQSQSQPQTPSNNIPDIIFTDYFSDVTGGDDPLMRQDFVKEIGNAMANMAGGFDTSDLFPSDDPLKVGLDPLDLDGLQMLADPDMVADPATEDSFRLDRL